MYLDLSEGAGGDLVILQRRRRNGPAGVEGLGKRRHLGSGRDLHAGKLGGIELLRAGGESGKGVNIETQQTSKIYMLSFPLVLLLFAFSSPALRSFTSFLSFQGAGREPLGLNCISKAEPRETQQS